MPSASSETSGSSVAFRDNMEVLYINLVVLDPSQLVERKVTASLAERKRIPKPFQKAATKLATKMATPERVAEQMATMMPQKLPAKMAKKGLTAVAQTVFHEGPYVVVQLQVQNVSPEALVEAQSIDQYDEDDGTLESKAKIEPDMAERIIGCIRSILKMIGLENKEKMEGDYLPRLLQKRMEPMMNEILEGKLDSKGVHAAAQVCKQDAQARYFYQLLQEVRHAQQNKTPMNEFKAKIISLNGDETASSSTTTAASSASKSKTN